MIPCSRVLCQKECLFYYTKDVEPNLESWASGGCNEKQTARKLLNLRAVRWTVGIDQEVVTLRGLYGNSRVWIDATNSDETSKLEAPTQPKRGARPIPYSPASVRAVAPCAPFCCRAPKPRLEQPALSLSHLTWSLDTSTTAIRTCHPTTSFPVLIAD